MTAVIVLDSSPLGLLTQRPGVKAADACRAWLASHASNGVRIVVPEVIDYELRRELLRLGKVASVKRLDQITTNPLVESLAITTPAMRLAAELWAKARQQGTPTADPHALDVDVILAAQALIAAFPPPGFVVATTNLQHLSLFVPAQVWFKI